jgi:ubiquinone/menaquinone biosynthesis C-methylase UbiE
MQTEVKAQRDYYRATASRYDEMHSGPEEENLLALGFMISAIDLLNVSSVLEIGAGTGRALLHLKEARPRLRLLGIEPSTELRTQAYHKGLLPDELTDGDAQALPFSDHEFDLVFEFASLHHISNPRKAVAEMLRTARKAIFISDTNNFGQGNYLARRTKQAINAFGLWPLFDLLRTQGRRYHWSEGDGVYYSYSVFNDFRMIRDQCAAVHVFNTSGASANHYHDAPSVALLGIKRA